MKITSLILKHNRVQVFIDERYAFSCTESFVVQNNLFREKEVSQQELDELKSNARKSIVEFKLFEYALRKTLSVRELKTKVTGYCLKKFDFKLNDEFFSQAFAKLERLQLYDEEKIIRKWIEKLMEKNKSKNYIVLKLVHKGFEKRKVELILDEYDTQKFNNNLETLLEKKLQTLKEEEKKDVFKTKQKLTQFALNKGYNYSQIKEILNKILEAI